MQHITQATSWPQRETRLPSFRLRPYLLVVFVVVTGFTVANIGARVLALYTIPPSNPFSSYADIFPGQPRGTLEIRGFSCSMQIYSNSPNEHCYFYPSAGAFSQVSVLVSEGVIRIIGFRLRENTLRVGDLMLLWDKPLTRTHSTSVQFYSGKSLITAFVAGNAGRFSHYQLVFRVVISNPRI